MYYAHYQHHASKKKTGHPKCVQMPCVPYKEKACDGRYQGVKLKNVMISPLCFAQVILYVCDGGAREL